MLPFILDRRKQVTISFMACGSDFAFPQLPVPFGLAQQGSLPKGGQGLLLWLPGILGRQSAAAQQGAKPVSFLLGQVFPGPNR